MKGILGVVHVATPWRLTIFGYRVSYLFILFSKRRKREGG
jgi:hypothetical protein